MGPRVTAEGAERVYEAAQQWVDRCLKSDDSLFTPGEAIWAAGNLVELRERFLDNPDETKGVGFLEKLEKQLSGCAVQVYQLMAETLYFHSLIVASHGRGGWKAITKLGTITSVLTWSNQEISLQVGIPDALEYGILNPGTNFILNYYEIGFLIAFSEQWKKLSSSKQKDLLNDAWAFKEFAVEINTEKDLRQREALLHLIFPDTFEHISSANHKRLIAKSFEYLVTPSTVDVDRKLAQIRAKFESEYKVGDHFFYQNDLEWRWKPDHKCDQCPHAPPGPNGPPKCSTDPCSSKSINALAQELFWEPAYLQDIITGLKDKGQVIFQGPPGTGKTYVAKRIGEWAKEHGGDYRIVQFHPSYSYEDFVEGYRPKLVKDNQVGFELRDGPLKEIAKKAEQNDKAKFILVIDEINRTNVSKVMGELYFLLEYRGEGVPLLYSKEEFKLPNNLWFIGTMNTTDRSIALVDAALRRRFYFYDFFPDEPPIEGLLRRWLEKNDVEHVGVADLVDHVNKRLEDRHLSIGPSHFMKKGRKLDEDRVRFIWERAVFPYIEEQLFDDDGKLKQFRFEKLKPLLAGKDITPTPGASQKDNRGNQKNGQS